MIAAVLMLVHNKYSCQSICCIVNRIPVCIPITYHKYKTFVNDCSLYKLIVLQTDQWHYLSMTDANIKI